MPVPQPSSMTFLPPHFSAGSHEDSIQALSIKAASQTGPPVSKSPQTIVQGIIVAAFDGCKSMRRNAVWMQTVNFGRMPWERRRWVRRQCFRIGRGGQVDNQHFVRAGLRWARWQRRGVLRKGQWWHRCQQCRSVHSQLTRRRHHHPRGRRRSHEGRTLLWES